ncbi:MAG: T9SS type A sorting domain-containing protein [Candidatus Aegiribacteria sp.]|nr:T9SS type A sorting domain-containing protein [Candidatus Aegiribacteria sp.]MBD3294235.1 T9SS type A sorting domain-containing protein [Candidatus Fermentibacteria bacterium]
MIRPSVFIVQILIIAIAGSAAAAVEGQIALTLEAGEYSLSGAEYWDTIEMDGFTSLNIPGKPDVPVARFAVLLPPGSRATSVNVLSELQHRLDGNYSIQPCAGILPAGNSLSYEQFMERLSTQWQENYSSIYYSGEDYPGRTAWLSGAGTLEQYSYAVVSFAPVSWNPASGELSVSDQVRISICYTIDDSEFLTEGIQARNDDLRDRLAERFFVNFNDMRRSYIGASSSNGQTDEVWDYVIITSSDLVDAITSSGFVEWKTLLGHSVKTVLVTDPEITDQPGQDMAEQVRNFLRSKYIEWEIDYVLLVGDYLTVPMRVCYPDSSYHVYDPSNPGLIAPGTPTDSYYSDLSYPDSLSWDLDDDGYLGEYNQDMPDFMPEVSVGRIPVSDPGRITYTLSKSVSFEQDHGAWKTNVLHAGTILFFENQNFGGYPFIDGATLLDSMETGLMGGWNITHMSEQAGIVTSPFDWLPVTKNYFTGTWGGGQFGVVNWSGHGWPSGVSRTVWMWDDGDGVPETSNGELQGYPLIDLGSYLLEDDYPSVVFAVSCDVGFPEPNPYGNFGIDMLTEPGWAPSIAMVCASRPAAISADWKNSPGGTEQICFDFNRYLISEGYRTGDALAWGRYDATAVYGWEDVMEYADVYNINLYGDPALKLEGYQTGIEDPEDPVNGHLVTIGSIGPNPFVSTCSIEYSLSAPSHVNLMIYDLHGRSVTSLRDSSMPAGFHTDIWEPQGIPDGVYFVKLTAGSQQSVQRVVLLE